MIKAVFFDFDGVLTTESSGTYSMSKYLSDHLDIDLSMIFPVLKSETAEMLVGRADYIELLPKVEEAIGISIPEAMLLTAIQTVPLNKAMFELAESIKERGVSVGVITDQSKLRGELLTKKFQLNMLFDRVIVSGSVGLSKKDSKAIFEIAVDNLELEPEEVLFIENTESNLTIPKQMGWQTYYHDDSKNDINTINKYFRRQQLID